MVLIFASIFLMVALLAEGVDRNLTVCHYFHPLSVALLAEGVDRNGCWQVLYALTV